MKYLTVAEIAERWNISFRRVTLLCNEGRVHIENEGKLSGVAFDV